MKKGRITVSSLRFLSQGLIEARTWDDADWAFQRQLFMLLCARFEVHVAFERLPRYEERHSAKSYCVLNNFTATHRGKNNDHLFIFLRILLFHCIHKMWSLECLEEISSLNI